MDGRLRPKEYACDVRRVLSKTITQPESEKPNIWFVGEDGANLSRVVEDARAVLLTVGMAWFEEFSELSRILSFAKNEPEEWDEKGTTLIGTWGLGRLGCPHRQELIADIETALRPW